MVDADPEAWRAELCIADALLAQDQPAEAEQRVRLLIQRRPEAAAAWSWLGRRAFARQDWATAAERYQRLVELSEGSKKARAATRWGVALLRQGARAGARQAFELALQADPEAGWAWLNLGVLANREGRSEDARMAFERATRVRPGLAEAWFNLGRAYRKAGLERAGLAAFEEALGLDPDDLEARLAAAELLIRRGRASEARVHLEQVRQASPPPELRSRLDALSEQARH